MADNRRMRRASAAQDGNVLTLFKRRASAESIPTSFPVEQMLLGIARQYGIADPSIESKGVFEPAGPKEFRANPNDQIDDVQAFHLIFDSDVSENNLSSRRILEVGESGGRILSIRELFAK